MVLTLLETTLAKGKKVEGRSMQSGVSVKALLEALAI